MLARPCAVTSTRTTGKKVEKVVLRSIILLAMIPSVPVAPVAASATATEPDLVFQPIIRNAEYCGGKGGAIVLRLQVEVRSDKAAEVPLILPLFGLASGYELFRDADAVEANRPDFSTSNRSTEVLDAVNTRDPKPDPGLFRLVPPGQTASFHGVVEIPVVPKGHGGTSLLGEDRYLRVHINPWPASRKEGERLRTLWQAQGLLWTREVVSLPIRIHVEQQPDTRTCTM